MKTGLGLISLTFMLIAAFFLYGGLNMETTVNTDAGDVANFQLMQIQSLNIALGIGAAIIAALFAVGAALKNDPPA